MCPELRKDFFKFWWNEEINLLKEASVESDKLWKSVGKPRDGPIFASRQSCRLKYRKCLRDNRKFETEQYTNGLHDALLQKNNTSFWQCWRLKFEYKKNPVFKLMAVLILILLRVDFLSILLEHTLVITLPRPIS